MLLHEEKVSQSRLPSDTQIPWKSNQSEIWHMCIYIYIYIVAITHTLLQQYDLANRECQMPSPPSPHITGL